MAIFVRSQSAQPIITGAIVDALRIKPESVSDVQSEALARGARVAAELATEIVWPRLVIAALIALLLLAGAIYAAKENLPDISKSLMVSFQSYSGVVVGALGGEVAASRR